MRKLLIATLGLLIALSIIGAGYVAWYTRAQRQTVFTDADSINQAIDRGRPRDILWRPPTYLAPVINTTTDEREAKVTRDGLTLYFSRGRPGFNVDLFYVTRTPEGWSEPMPLEAVNSAADELGPEPSSDGTRLYFYSDRFGGQGGYDLWVVERDENGVGGWGEPRNLGAAVNSPFDDYGIAAVPGGESIYFSSNRPLVDISETTNMPAQPGDYNLFQARIVDGEVQQAEPVLSLNTEHDEASPAISPAGDFLYFASNRPGGFGGFDLYRVRRLDGAHVGVTNLYEPVNTEGDELDPGLSMEGFGLHYSADRSEEGETDDFNLWFTSSREVFARTDVTRAEIDWSELLSILLPYLIWAILTILITLLLIWLMRKVDFGRYEKLSLLARCLLASLIAHMILMLLLTFWGVTAAVSDYLSRGEPMKVVITSPSVGGGVAGQIRGELTEVEVSESTATSVASRQQVSMDESASGADQAQITVNRSEMTAESAPSERAEARENQPQPAATDQPETALETPTSSSENTNVETPASPERQQVTEAAAAEAAEVVEAAQSSRSDQSTPVAEVDARVQTDASASNVAPAEQASRTAVDATSVNEATAPSPNEVATTDQAQAVTATNAEETSLPAVDQAAREQVAETSTEVAPATVGAQPSDAQTRELVEADTGETQQVAMEVEQSSASELSSEQLVDGVDASDATRVPENAVARTTAEAAPTDQTDVALQAMNVERAEATTESQTTINATASETARLASAASEAATAQAPLSAQVSSDAPASDAALADSTMVEDDASDVPSEAVSTSLATSSTARDVTGEATTDAEVAVPATGEQSNVTETTSTVVAADVAANRSNETVGLVNNSAADAETMIEQPSRAANLPAGAPSETLSDASDARVARATPAQGTGAAEPPDSFIASAANIRIPGEQLDTTPMENVEVARSVAAPVLNTSSERREMDLDVATADIAMEFDVERAIPNAPSFVPPTPLAMDVADDASIGPEEIRANLAPPTMISPDVTVAALPLDTDIPTPADQPAAYTQRSADKRDKVLEQMGGSEATEHAVSLALEWLARHQSVDGRWDGRNFDEDGGESWGRAPVKVDIALTGLSLLAFLAADHTHTRPGPYQLTVRRAIDWLIEQQERDGNLMTEESMYSHGIATIALAEAYGMTGDPRLAEPIKMATDFIYQARNRQIGGWRYAPGQVGDTSVLGWQIMALVAAEKAGIDVPEDAFNVARQWLTRVSTSRHPGLYAYQPDRAATPAMTAEGMFVKQIIGDYAEDQFQRAAEYLIENLPDWEAEVNTYYWYYGTLALFKYQGREWERWNERIKDTLIDNQVKSGLGAGSWDPTGRWANVGGRIYQTALATLTLEVYYRYLPGFMEQQTNAAPINEPE